AEHIQSDALFHAALVSFGSFGLVHGYVFEAVPLYELSRYRTRVDQAVALSWFDLDFSRIAREAHLPAHAPYHFEIVFDPYQRKAGQRGAYVTAMYQAPPLDSPPPPPTRGFEPGDDVLDLVGRLQGPVSAPVSDLVSQVAASQLDEAAGEQATPGRTFSNTSVRGSVLSAELAVALNDGRRTVETLLDEAARRAFAGLVSVRFVRGSRATLAFTRFSPTSVTIE